MILSDNVSVLKGIGPKKRQALENMNICTLEDLAGLFPRRYEDRRTVTRVSDTENDREYILELTILSIKYDGNPYKKNRLLRLLATDDTMNIEIVFFNGKYLSGYFKPGQIYSFYGKVSLNMGRKQMIHPEFHRVGDAGDVRGIISVYPPCEGISQNELRRLQTEIRPLYKEIKEWLPQATVDRNRLASPEFALDNIHFPRDGQAVLQSKFRLIFEELMILQTGLFYMRKGNVDYTKERKIDTECASEFINGLSFSLTEGQRRAWREISGDMSSKKAMNRLVQGDVGCGKTAVAEIAMFTAVRNGMQAIMMAPTEILAKQHYKSLSEDFSPYGIKVAMLTGSMKASEKKAVLSGLADGKIDILTGTHAVLSENVTFGNLGLVITDEQHRFGVRQRSLLAAKGKAPDVMVMTATPIPRTLAVILYGDLDISIIDTMPAGRKAISTESGREEDRERIYRFACEQVKSGRQVYVVAPLISESESIDAKSAEELYDELKERFTGYNVALIHGAMKQDEKDQVMNAFAAGTIDVLVSTVVIEVGINVANASVMIIENSERFGLAQLHQLRGRVGRGNDQSYCFLISSGDSEIAARRNEIMVSSASGFDIAEEDLLLRGPGEIFGTRQHGLPEMHISDLVRHADIMEKVRVEANIILADDPSLSKEENKILKLKIKQMFGDDVKLEL